MKGYRTTVSPERGGKGDPEGREGNGELGQGRVP